jgi:thiol-disulfide isomerase/thioredoxin
MMDIRQETAMLPASARALAPLCLLALLGLAAMASDPSAASAAGSDQAAAPAPSAKPAGDPAAVKLIEAGQLLEQRRYDLALEAFKKANRLAGGSCVECLLGLSRAANQLGAYADALDSSRQVIALAKERGVLAQAHNQLGLALHQRSKGKEKEDLAAAEQAFRQVLELSRDGFELARFNLGLTLLELGRDKEGVAVLEQFVEEHSDDVLAARARSLIANPRRAREDLAPEFSFVTLDGRSRSLEDYAGKVVLLDFWGTWCPPCREAIPTLKSLHSRLAGSQPFVLVGVSVGTEKEKLEEFLAGNGIAWPQTVDERGDVSELFGVKGYPTHLLIDPEGRIVYRHRGWGRTSPKELQAEVGRALRNAARTAKRTGGA